MNELKETKSFTTYIFQKNIIFRKARREGGYLFKDYDFDTKIIRERGYLFIDYYPNKTLDDASYL